MQKEMETKQHRIRVRLYQSRLPTTIGKFFARTVNEAMLTIAQIAASAKTRGGYTGSLEDMIEHVKLFLWEMFYQLCDGFGVDLDFFTLQPHVGGTFDKATEAQDDERHPVNIRFYPRSKLKKLTNEIDVVVEGLADTSGCIDEFVDVEEEAVNSIFVPGDLFIITGWLLKIAGSDPACGVYLSPVDNPLAEVKIVRLAENTSTKIIGICPQTGYQRNRIVVRTQYSGSLTKHLKNMRVITSDFVIEEA